MTLCEILIRPCVLRFTSFSLAPSKRGVSTSYPLLLSKGGLSRSGLGKFLTVRSSMSSSSTSVGQLDRILGGRNDDHEGVVVEMTNEPLDPAVFASLLRASLSQWRQQGKRGVWIKMPIELVSLVEVAVKEGFYFHHAEPKYLMLVLWLPTTPSTLPANASHRVGIGAFVLNEKNEVLVVQEKSGNFRGTGVWKFPTGVVDEGEDICDAVVREVKEETGIDSKFLEVLAFRQSHKSYFEKSDLFFVCMLQPLSTDIQLQEAEIEAAQAYVGSAHMHDIPICGDIDMQYFYSEPRDTFRWMPFEEYVAQPFIQTHDLLKKLGEICLATKDREYAGFSPVATTTGFSQKKSYLYMNNRSLNFED